MIFKFLIGSFVCVCACVRERENCFVIRLGPLELEVPFLEYDYGICKWRVAYSTCSTRLV